MLFADSKEGHNCWIFCKFMPLGGLLSYDIIVLWNTYSLRHFYTMIPKLYSKGDVLMAHFNWTKFTQYVVVAIHLTL